MIIDGRHVYLGLHGSTESREAYARLIAERFTPAVAAKTLPVAVNGFPDLSVNEVLLRYIEFAERYYVKDGKPTKELVCMKEAMGPLRALFGDMRAQEFGPLRIKAVQQRMIDSGLSRGVINHRTNRIKRILKWGVSEELLPAAIYEIVRIVAGLRFGRSAARETEPVGPVADHWVDAVLAHVAPQVAAMIELQRLTGMRPGEVIKMRPVDIDRTGEIWFYEPSDHKNRWRGHRRRIPFGPKSKLVIRPFLDRPEGAFLFSRNRSRHITLAFSLPHGLSRF